MESEMKPNELRVLTKEFLQKHLGYPDETAYKLSDELLASIHSLLLKGAPESRKEGQTFAGEADLTNEGFNACNSLWHSHIKKVIGE
jgi:hypothetical protein